MPRKRTRQPEIGSDEEDDRTLADLVRRKQGTGKVLALGDSGACEDAQDNDVSIQILPYFFYDIHILLTI